MDDKKISDHINELAREEHELFERESHGNANEADRGRLQRIVVFTGQLSFAGRRRSKMQLRVKSGLHNPRPKRTMRLWNNRFAMKYPGP